MRKLMRLFSTASGSVKIRNDEAESEDSSATRISLVITHLDSSVLPGAGDHVVLEHTQAAAAHTRSGKQTASFSGRALSSRAASLL